MKVTRKSAFTGHLNTMEIDCTAQQLFDFHEGKGFVQDIFPNLTAGEREFLMTGCTPEEWDTMFPKCPECKESLDECECVIPEYEIVKNDDEVRYPAWTERSEVTESWDTGRGE